MPWISDALLWSVNQDLGRSMWNTDCVPAPACTPEEDPSCDEQAELIGIMPAQCDPLHGHLHRATWAAYLEALREVASGPLARIGGYAQAQRDKVHAAVMRDPHGPGLVEWKRRNAWLDVVLVEQRREIRRLLAATE